MKTTKSLIALAVGLSLVQGSVLAQETQKSANTLETTVIHAKSIKRDAVIETITSEQIDVDQINDAEDLVKYVPGVNVSKGDDRWGSSGFNIRGLDEDRVAITVDGVPQGETLKYEGGQAYGYFKGSRNGVDIEALKRVEIIKGADAILSGNGALSGAVNMTTKDPEDLLTESGDDTSFGVKLGYSGNNDEKMGSFSFANRTGNVESLLIYTQRDGNEYENFNTKGKDIEGAAREVPDPQDRETKSLLTKVIYQISDNSEIGLIASKFERNTETDAKSFNGGWYSNRKGDDTSEVTRFGVFYSLEAETSLFDRLEVALNNQDVDFEARTSQHVEFDFGPRFSADEDRVDIRSYDQSIFQLTLDMVKSFELAGQQHELTYGLEWQDKEFQNIQTRQANSNLNDLGWVSRNIGALVPKSESDIKTIYALDTFNISNDTQFRLGARFDDISYDASADANFSDDTQTLGKVSFNAFTWTLGVEHQLTDNLALEAGVSTGFRAPTIEELYITSGTPDDWDQAPNPNLDPEYATNFDVALVGETESFNYRIGAFFSDYKDFIENKRVEGTNPNTNMADPDGYLTPTNASDAEIKGIEVSVDMNLGKFGLDGFNTSIEAAYTDGEEDNGDPIYSVQPLNAVWRLSYDADKWGAMVLTNFIKGKENDDAYSTAADGTRTYPLYLSNTATIIDLRAFYDISENITLRAGVNNLTDKEYFLWDNVRFVDQADLRPGIGVRENGIRRYTEPGRNFEVSLNVVF